MINENNRHYLHIIGWTASIAVVASTIVGLIAAVIMNRSFYIGLCLVGISIIIEGAFPFIVGYFWLDPSVSKDFRLAMKLIVWLSLGLTAFKTVEGIWQTHPGTYEVTIKIVAFVFGVAFVLEPFYIGRALGCRRGLQSQG